MKKITEIHHPSDITGFIPGVKGQRAFPTTHFNNSDPFLMLDHIGPQSVGADWKLAGEGHDHPHRGFETLTFMFEGKMNHRDSLRNRATLQSGSVQRMNAGSGIIHGGSMFSDPETARFHEMQLWINNPKDQKMSRPSIHNVSDMDIPRRVVDGIKLRVISGKLNGLQGPVQTLASTQIGHAIAEKSGVLNIASFSNDAKAMIYVLEGEVSVEGQKLESYQLAQLSHEGTKVNIQMGAASQVLILAGIPFNKPVVFGGPFVMNTQEEIDQAHRDFQKGLFGQIEEKA